MQGNPIRVAALAALFWMAAGFDHAAVADDSALPDSGLAGFWLVSEHGPPVNQGIASIPIIGLAERSKVGNPRAVWEIRYDGRNFAIDILSRDLTFPQVTRDGNRLSGSIPDPDGNNARIKVDVSIADGKLTGRLSYPNVGFDLDGRLPEAVDSMRQELTAARSRIVELNDPYSIPENERLRQENIVLIQRIRRVEDELARVSAQHPSQLPTPSGRSTLQISTKGMAVDGVTAGPTTLRSLPSTAGDAIRKLGGGQPIFRIADATTSGWVLAADSQGNVGYMRSAEIVQAGRSGSPQSKTSREIVVSFPVWDNGRLGKRMTVNDPGYVSIVGRVRGDGALRDLRIADSQTVFNSDGSFTSVMQVPPKGRRVHIEAVFADGPVTTLDFEIAVGK